MLGKLEYNGKTYRDAALTAILDIDISRVYFTLNNMTEDEQCIVSVYYPEYTFDENSFLVSGFEHQEEAKRGGTPCEGDTFIRVSAEFFPYQKSEAARLAAALERKAGSELRGGGRIRARRERG